MYNSLNSSPAYEQSLIDYLHSLISASSKLILMGHFNVPDINWATLSGSSMFSNKLCDLVFQFNLPQLVDQPSHICGSILDLVFTNCESDIFVHNTNSFDITSDHHQSPSHFLSVPLIPPIRQQDYVFDYSKRDYIGLNQYISACDLTTYYNTTDVNKAWTILKQLLLTGMDLFILKIKLKST